MADFNVRADSVNVEQIMEQIRARIRDKRGVDYTEQQIRELAAVKLEKFLDPRGVRSDLLEQFRRLQPPYEPPELPNYVFEESTLFESHRGPLRWIRNALRPILKLFFNPNPLIQALNIQSRLNTTYAEREARRESARRALDQLYFEVMHNLVVETTRLGIEVKNLKMRVESVAGRLDFNERRARALESVVAYKPAGEDKGDVDRRGRATTSAGRDIAEAVVEGDVARKDTPVETGSSGTPASGPPEGPGQRSRRRRRRRGRRSGVPAASMMGGGHPEAVEPSAPPAPASPEPPVASSPEPSAPGPSTPSRPDVPDGSDPRQQ